MTEINFNVQLNEAKKLERLGNDVVFAYCAGIFTSCMANRDAQPLICKSCKKTATKSIKILPRTIKVIPMGKDSNSHFLSESVKLLQCNTLSEIKELTYKGVYIGYSIASYYISLSRNPDPILNNRFKSFLEYIYAETIGFIDSAEQLVVKYKPNKVILYNGRVYETRAFMDLAIKYSIPFVCNEVKKGYLNDDSWKIVHFENSLPHDTTAFAERCLETWELSSLTENEKIRIGSSFYEKRRNGFPAGDKVYISDQIKGLLPADYSKNKKNIVIFNSSEDEFASLGSEFEKDNLFKSQYNGILHMLEQFRDIKDYHFYLRIHPNLKDVNFDYHLSLYSLEKQFNNITIIPPDDRISSYAILDIAEKVIVFGSTMGIESVYWGKPTILLSSAFYYYFDVCYVPKAIQDIKPMIIEKLIPKDKYNAIKYGFYILDNNVLSKNADFIDIKPREMHFLNFNRVILNYVNVFALPILNKLFSLFLYSRFSKYLKKYNPFPINK